MRVMCINASPLRDHANIDLHLLKEGNVYEVIDIHPLTGAYNIGIGPYHCLSRGINCYWGSVRFLPCEDNEEVEDEIKIKTNGKEGSDSEEDQRSNC